MASIGHVIVGMAGARLARHAQSTVWHPFTAMVLWSGLSLLPDADVLGFLLGVPYEAPWGHRGATHSFAFAAAVALTVGIVAAFAGRAALRSALIAAVVVGSHAILDSLTDGGLGCALLWPFSNARYFAPWRPLPVAPIGRDFFSDAGLTVATVELVLFSPLLIYALWRRRGGERPSR